MTFHRFLPVPPKPAAHRCDAQFCMPPPTGGRPGLRDSGQKALCHRYPRRPTAGGIGRERAGHSGGTSGTLYASGPRHRESGRLETSDAKALRYGHRTESQAARLGETAQHGQPSVISTDAYFARDPLRGVAGSWDSVRKSLCHRHPNRPTPGGIRWDACGTDEAGGRIGAISATALPGQEGACCSGEGVRRIDRESAETLARLDRRALRGVRVAESL